MVNEFNKANEPSANEQLSERLTASNQRLQEMQAEHQQLLQEMEQLRRRAEELHRIRSEQEQLQQLQRAVEEAPTTSAEAKQEVVGERTSSDVKQQTQENEDDQDPAAAEYIRQKLDEIAKLKAQFKRVQNMINTTNLIEQHIAAKTGSSKQVPPGNSPQTPQMESTTKTSKTLPTTEPLNAVPSTVEDPHPSTTSASTSSSDEKEQLLASILDMFQDFSTDLRGQADSLRAERERIRALKEQLIRQKNKP